MNEIAIMVGILVMVLIITLLLLSVLKGIGDILDQQREITNKKEKWFTTICELLGEKFNENEENFEVSIDTIDSEDKNRNFQDGLKLLDELREKNKSS